jgi:hypothetical protein
MSCCSVVVPPCRMRCTLHVGHTWGQPSNAEHTHSLARIDVRDRMGVDCGRFFAPCPHDIVHVCVVTVCGGCVGWGSGARWVRCPECRRPIHANNVDDLRLNYELMRALDYIATLPVQGAGGGAAAVNPDMCSMDGRGRGERGRGRGVRCGGGPAGVGAGPLHVSSFQLAFFSVHAGLLADISYWSRPSQSTQL